MTLRVAFLGMGMMGQMHLKLIAEHYPQVKIAAVCDTFAANLAKATEMAPSATAFEDPDALIAADVDAIILSTPGFTHADLTEQCLAAGKHVFAEKPVMTTRQGCHRMVELANRYPKLAIVINHELRYSKYWGKLRELIAAGEIGKPHFAWCKCFRPPFLPKVNNWIQDQRFSGGAMVDMNSHHFDLMNWYVAAKPRAVSGFGGNDVVHVVSNANEIIDHAAVSFEYDNGIRGGLWNLMFAPSGGGQMEIGVAGDGGIIQTRNTSNDILIWKRNGDQNEPTVHHSPDPRPGLPGFVEAHDAFFEAMQGKRALTDVRDCVDGTLLAIAAEEAVRTRSIVEV